ncbi:hypothetical protein RHS01_09003 [Rhizoctonia solani]|uniref:Retrotransposon gag domain-containing protein n=1 Tax=Rhizoctonia solani TaxID=456999 RepID=A0A8H7I842_9AGAM|nr:hypothetical protein RHS01_09003 [Rhizoctonia solani]
MELELSIAALLEAVTALTATVGSLQDQIKSQGQQLSKLKAICKETADLLGNKDQGGVQAQPGPLTGPVTPPLTPGGKPTLQARSLTPFDSGSTVKQPKMELPNPYKGNTRGHKATQWLDQMLLWVALHCNQFDKEEQMVVWILYHMTDKAADWALPIIGTIIKGKGNPPTTILALTANFKEAFANPNAKRAAARKIATLTWTTTTSEYVTKFCNLIAELDWNKEVS